MSTSNEPSLANSSVLDIKFSFLLAPWINKGNLFRGGSRTATTSRMERFLIIVNGWKPLTIITKHSILDVAEALDPPLLLKVIYNKWKYLNLSNISWCKRFLLVGDQQFLLFILLFYWESIEQFYRLIKRQKTLCEWLLASENGIYRDFDKK